MNNIFKTEIQKENLVRQLCYEMYKLDWLFTRPHLQGLSKEELESIGEIYVCFNEFVDNEFAEYRNTYIDALIDYVQEWRI